jgi:hypothetical protein
VTKLVISASGVSISTLALGDVFTTEGRPLQQAWTPIAVTVGGGSGPLPSGIVFPDLDKGYGYTYLKGISSGIPYDACDTYGMALPQEWGPPALGYASPHQLADIDLGAAPDGADFLEMSVNLTQATVPSYGSKFALLLPWPCEISQGSWMDCEDGCCPVEAMVGLARQFWVEIVSGRIVLRRQQSVTDATVIPAAPSFGLPAYSGLLTHNIDDRLGAGNNSNLGQSNACSTTNSVNYETAYTGQLLITPVNYKGP